MNFNQIINKLQESRQVFHSEDDLKFAMAWVIKELYPSYHVRLEKPININMITNTLTEVIARAPIDIVVLDPIFKNAYPIEIKYKTKKAAFESNGESFSLANHGANDGGRYSFRKDIYRIENVNFENYIVNQGFVFILTNDKGYYENNVNVKNSLDSNFSFHHGAVLLGDYIGWNYDKLPKGKYNFGDEQHINPYLKKHWTSHKEYIYKLELKRNYLVEWNAYSHFKLDRAKSLDFRYCLIEVGR
ncbi:hypothetical protein J5U18_09305 [Sphingobacteriaceae bacterium WQ 2009]|uniref:Uncharacterized protein n=1 Tax=Rhinopithecimicrobium faecis TaxID=2820698 RepID=A0A8T4HEI8_9SPHI|nr:hypothetical protein [Sphingobacteriaceae bacterium WQ 2009]